MLPYFSQSGIPIEQDRFGSDRPPSRIQVQQYYLQHARQRHLQVSGGFSRPPLDLFGKVVMSFRHSFGRVLIGLGVWMTRRPATGADVLARR